MVASIQPACLVYRVQMRPAFIHPRIDISGRLANLKASANRSRNHIRFNHARFNSVQQQTLPAAFVADIFGRYPLRLRKWPNSSLDLAALAKPDLASWLQAFAAIVALGISVWATWRVGAAERKRDRLQAHGIAVAIYPELLKLQVTVDYIRKGLQQ